MTEAQGWARTAVTEATGLPKHNLDTPVRIALKSGRFDGTVKILAEPLLTDAEAQGLRGLEAPAYGGTRGAQDAASAAARIRYQHVLRSALQRGVRPGTIARQTEVDPDVLGGRARRVWTDTGHEWEPVDYLAAGIAAGRQAQQVYQARPDSQQQAKRPLRAPESSGRTNAGTEAGARWAPPAVATFDGQTLTRTPTRPRLEPARSSAKRDEHTAAHHAAVQAISRAAAGAGHEVTALANHGQDAAFRAGTTLVNVEVKTLLGLEPRVQFRLGLGQVLEQLERHLRDLTHGYSGNGNVTRVQAALVIDRGPVPDTAGNAEAREPSPVGELWHLWRATAGRAGVILADVARFEDLIAHRVW